MAARILGGLAGQTEQYLPGGGDVDFFDWFIPALSGQVKAVHRVDLVAPELETRGLFHVGRVDIHNVAADGKLARPIHLVAPGVAAP